MTAGEGGSVCLSTYQDDIGNYEKFAEKANVQLQNLLVCVEMFIAAMAHRTVFSYRDYKSGTKKTAIAGLRDMVPKEVLRDVLAMLKSTRNPQVEYLARVMKKWGDRHETAKANGQKCCIRSKTDELDGTIEYMGEKMLPCANKECYSHPLTVDQMCVPPLVSHLPHLTPHIPTSHTPYSNSSGTTASARSRSPS